MESKIYVKKGSSAKDESRGNDRPQTKPKMKVFSGEDYKAAPRNTKVEPHLHLLQKYSNYNWNGLDINDLYSDFKEIEKNLKIIVEVKFPYI
jgi:hypothetical protein